MKADHAEERQPGEVQRTRAPLGAPLWRELFACCPSGYPAAVHRSILVLSVLLLASTARAQATEPALVLTMDVSGACGTPESFRARLEALDAARSDAHVYVEVAPSWAGLMRGRLLVEREGAVPVERVIEDHVCADVIDALAITAALVLRSPPEPAPPPPPETPSEIRDDPAPEDAESPAPSLLRGTVSFGFRVGLGMVPALSVAPDLALGFEFDRFVTSLHLLYWPEAGAPSNLGEAGTQGVALQAFASGLELGVRLGDQVGATLSGLFEVGAVLGRGVEVAAPLTQVVLAADAGAAVAGYVELGALRLVLRFDVLFAVAQPAYAVASGVAYETPLVRGTGGLAVSYLF